MNRLANLLLPGVIAITLSPSLPASWPPARSPAIPQADGYIAIPNAAVPPQRGRTYKAIFDATLSADRPAQLLPALNMAGSELNALGVAGLSLTYAKFVVVFHDGALNGILSDARYRTKYGIANPNLPVLAAMKKAGVELYVCGQNLASAHIDPSTISRDVTVASDALIVLMTYQNDGYALLSY